MSDAETKPDLAHVDVRYVADLARIALSDEEIAQFEGELEDILDYMAQMNDLDLDHLEPTAHPAARLNVMRDDVVSATLPRDLFLQNAPATVDDAYLRVPPVIEEEAP